MPLTLISLTSRESMANLIPAMELKPAKAYLLTTENFTKEAGYLKSVMEPKGVKTVIYDRNIDAYRPETIRHAIREIASNEKNNDLILNVTGGTKLMAIAAYEEFRAAGWPILYCDTPNLRLLKVFPEESGSPLARPVSIDDYMKSYGFTISDEEERQYNPMIAVLMDWLLAGHFRDFSAGVDKFRKKVLQNIPAGGIEQGPFLFQKQFDRYHVHIKSLKETIPVESTFLHGKWLECLAYHYLKTRRQLPSKLGVKILQHGEIPNEIDALYMKNYQLHLVSCKTGRYEPKDLFELDTLRHLTGGTFGVGIVLMTGGPTEAFARRAKELNLRMIWMTEPEDLEELP